MIGTVAFTDAGDARRHDRARRRARADRRRRARTAWSRPAAGSRGRRSRRRMPWRRCVTAGPAASSTRAWTATARCEGPDTDGARASVRGGRRSARRLLRRDRHARRTSRPSRSCRTATSTGVIVGKALYERKFSVDRSRAWRSGRRSRERAQARDPVPRRRQGARREGHQLRGPARCRRPGGAGRALRRRGRRRARVPGHHRVARAARDDRAAGAAHRGQRLHPVHDRGRHPFARGCAGRARRGRRQGVRQLRRGRTPGPDGRAGRHVRRSVRGARDRRETGRRQARGLRQRRPGGHGPRRRRVGARGRRARSGGDPAHQHGPRRHEGRLRPGADPRGGGGRRHPRDRVGRRRRAVTPERGDHRSARRRGAGRVDLPLRAVQGPRREGAPPRRGHPCSDLPRPCFEVSCYSPGRAP